jgi:flavin reductase (DIM6/NTAB) family NADH-FMN oxidoreductase RutF
MEYQPRLANHGLPHEPFAALVVPRPIGWISTVSTGGIVNLAPYSYFNIVSQRPHYVMFASAGRKHSQTNAEEQGEFVVNVASYELLEAVNLSSAVVEVGESEADLLALPMASSTLVRPPRVAASPAALECRYTKTVSLPDWERNEHFCHMIIGEVVNIHIADHVIVDGRVDLAQMRPLTRLGYMDYAVVESWFAVDRPSADDLRTYGARTILGREA